ncbi:MAG: hypothetical protein HC896_06165 [Bacteroidales bacterium]|nr:hypothetical protein [Bacteroidales bacterium]
MNKEKEQEIESFNLSEEVLDEIMTAKKIFYSLPSPLETAMIIKTAGAEYNEELLNSVDNVNNYTTNKSMALNLGIYTTDMSYASLFDQTQSTISFMNISKKLADGLGILDAIDDNTIERLEENINNREVIMDIISETFMSSSSYLKENERAPVATIVLVGGWIEGLYIATQLVGEGGIENNKLVDRVVEQKLSFEILEKLLSQYKYDEDIQSLTAQMQDLRNVLKKVEITHTANKTSKDNETKVTTLKSKISYQITPEVFKELTSVVETLRSNFIL